MYTTVPDDYVRAIREQVCSRCIDRPPGGPPCLSLGRRCGIELHLAELIDAVHGIHAGAIDLYADAFHVQVCPTCPNRDKAQCPCPLDYLLLLAVEAIEDVDAQRLQATDCVAES